MKKKIKELIVCILVATLTAGSMTQYMCSAAGPRTFDKTKDPNGDGVITVADATYISLCLRGRYFVQRYSNLDMDNNGLVTEVDAKLILYYDAGLI